jgi:integrase
MSLAYPKDIPKPTRRKGGLTYEIRVRVPPEARGGKFKGTHTSRTLGTRDKAEALRHRLKVYGDLQAEFEAEAAMQVASYAAGKLPLLSIEDVCRLRSEHMLQCERTFRREHIAGFRGDPVSLADQYRARLQRALNNARAEAIVRDFRHEDWFLNFLAADGKGEVANRDKALSALARTKVKVWQEIIADDEALALETALQQQPSSVPSLSEHANAYLARRSDEVTGDYRGLIQSVVRDFIALAGRDKAVTAYNKADAVVFVDALHCLPANWRKDRKLRNLDIVAAAKAAKDSGLPRQSAESIRKKIRLLSTVFADANERYGGVGITFPTGGLPKRAQANEQRDPFTEVELSELLASNIPGHLNWLTWLGLYTGARLNELAQLTTKHIQKHGDIHYIRFDADLRLKSGSCIRSVPIHKKLIELGFLDYVSKQSGLLFPGITKHSSGRFSDAPSKAFGRHLRAIGLKRRKLSFHSLRHTFASRFKVAAPREVETRERLLGHAVTGVAGRYGGDYLSEASDMPLLRARVLEKLKF